MSETHFENHKNTERAPVVRMNLWLETDDGVAFGLGRLLLLEALENKGSLKSAADSLNMSYRAAWGKLKTTESVLGCKLLEKNHGNRAGYQLTPYGRDLVFNFRSWFDAVEKAALDKANTLFPFAASPYGTTMPKTSAK